MPCTDAYFQNGRWKIALRLRREITPRSEVLPELGPSAVTSTLIVHASTNSPRKSILPAIELFSTMILSACSLLFIALVNARCYDHTPAFPLPKYDLHHPLLQQTFAEISAAIEAEIALPDWDPASVSIEVTSSKESLWSKHHTARVRNSSRQDVEFVDGDTLYRIASITKTFTTLGILYQHAAGNLSLDDPIDKYLEELKEEQNGTLPWKDITLRSLASQLSGIPRDCEIP